MYFTQGPWEVRGLIVLMKTCSVLLCVLEQPRIDNSSEGPIGRNWSIGLRPALISNMWKSKGIDLSISKQYKVVTNNYTKKYDPKINLKIMHLVKLQK